MRASSNIQSIREFRGRRVLLGPERSGSRSVAKRILLHHGVELSAVNRIQVNGCKIESLTGVDAAIVVLQVGNPRMNELLQRGEFRMLPLAMQCSSHSKNPRSILCRLRHKLSRWKSACRRHRERCNDCFLVARSDNSSKLVDQTLIAIYSPEVMAECRILGPEKAAHWQGFAWHPAADRFFEKYRVLSKSLKLNGASGRINVRADHQCKWPSGVIGSN